MTKFFLSAAGLLGLAALVACDATPVSNPMPGGEGATGLPSARALYSESCAGCHGQDGTGNGPSAAALLTRPSDLTTIALRNGGTFPRNKVMTIIDGYQRGAHVSAAMPQFGAGYMGEPTIWDDGSGFGTPIPSHLKALADYLESIQRGA